MKPKMFLAIAFFLFSIASFAWPTLPKAIAVGNGTYECNNTQTPFLWGILQSLSRNKNIYILISTHVCESDRLKLESDLEVILLDEGSTLLRVRLKADKKQSLEIAKIAIERIATICPNFHFMIDPALCISRQ